MQLHHIFFNSMAFPDYKRLVHDSDHTFGVFCSGGTVANITALWIARNSILGPTESFVGASKVGLNHALQYYGFKGAAVVGSEMMHYSFRKSVDLLGIGEDGLVTVPVDDQYRVRVDLMQAQIERLRQAKICVLAVIGIAGTTERYLLFSHMIHLVVL